MKAAVLFEVNKPLVIEDVSLALDLAPRTVARDWAFARARLTQLLAPED